MCNCTYSYDYFIIFFNSEHKATPRTAKNVVKLATLQRPYSCAYKALQGVRCKARYRGLTITALFSPLLRHFSDNGIFALAISPERAGTPRSGDWKMGQAAVLPPLVRRSSGKLASGNSPASPASMISFLSDSRQGRRETVDLGPARDP